MRLSRTTARFLLVGAATSLILLALSAPALAIPTLTRPEIVARAESAVGTVYTWGRESWTPNSSGTGPDCSGYVLKSWEVPRTMLYQEEHGENSSIYPRYTTYQFYNGLGPWYELSSRTYLKEGDALVYRSGGSGHIVLYAGGDRYRYPVVYEAPYSGARVRRASRYISPSYKPIRRYSLGDGSILLDNPTAKTTGGTDIGGNWTRSTSNPGYYGSNYQVHKGTSKRSYARWTPRLSLSGHYNIYMRWTDGWNRATNARVTINTPGGQKTRYVNQRYSGGRWVELGSYYFAAGYSTGSGSVSIHATGANGYVVADSVLFARSGY